MKLHEYGKWTEICSSWYPAEWHVGDQTGNDELIERYAQKYYLELFLVGVYYYHSMQFINRRYLNETD